MSSVSAPFEDVPSKAFSSSVDVFHFFLGLPLNAMIFILKSFYIGFVVKLRHPDEYSVDPGRPFTVPELSAGTGSR
jgi:hypothetical protein